MDDNLEEALSIVAENIKSYRTMRNFNPEDLLTIMQQIVGSLHFLEQERTQYYLEWTKESNKLANEGVSIAKANKQADIKVPELYMLRHIMKSAYENVGAIRTTLKNVSIERQNSN